MKKLNFRQFHLSNFFRLLDSRWQPDPWTQASPPSWAPLDKLLQQYYIDNKALGSHDRKEIGDTIYSVVRNKRLLDYFGEKTKIDYFPPKNSSNFSSMWLKRFELWEKKVWEHDPEVFQSLPPDIRWNHPKWLYDMIVSNYGEQNASEILEANNLPAPVTIRVNDLLMSRGDWARKYGKEDQFQFCKYSSRGVIFEKRQPFNTREDFQIGIIDIQDEGSQLLSELVQPNPGDIVLDYCAGSGGKSLAFAPQMKGKGTIYLNDVRGGILEEANKRFKRSGIQNIQIIFPKNKQETLTSLKEKVDWLVLDVPCSGTGTIRRSPDVLWKLTPHSITACKSNQRRIVKEALDYLKPDGKLVYMTCSILSSENEEQIDSFCRTFHLEVVNSLDSELQNDSFFLQKSPTFFKSLPSKNGSMDGYFGQVLKKKKL